jgi:PilZ domain
MEDRRLEHRRSKRTKTYRPARILIQDSTVHHCTVHNFTSSGVCIELTFEAEQLPDKFEFSLDNFRTFYVCKTIWREDCVAGVAFETLPTESPESRRAKLRIVRPSSVGSPEAVL